MLNTCGRLSLRVCRGGGVSRQTVICHVRRGIQSSHKLEVSLHGFPVGMRQNALLRQNNVVRTLSSSSDNSEKKYSKEDEESKEIVLTPGQQVVAATQLTVWFGVAVFAGFCAYFIGKELIPTKMSPNRVFDRSFAIIRNEASVKERYGEPIKAYGRDHGGHREGRRNFVEHTEYTDKDDGSKRTRVRYNLEGRFGQAFVFAEVSSGMDAGEFVYVLVQDKSDGRVQTIIDNRAALTAARLAAGSKEAQSAMSQLLSGSSKK